MKTQISAKHFFLHVGAIASFYASIIALILLLFRVINVAFPQMYTSVYQGSSTISFQVATLIVAFPLFLFLSWLLQKSYSSDPSLKDASLRRWLAYITLFIAGAVMAGDLVTIIYMFLDGRELTSGFLLKVLVLLVIACGVFAYYLRDIRGVIEKKERNAWRAISSIFIISSIILGFVVVGSPATQRAIRYDQERLSDLQATQWQLINYWQQKGELPSELSMLNDAIGGFSVPSDPETDLPYTYIQTSPTSFQLCAVFNLESPDAVGIPSLARMPYYEPGMMRMEAWDHPAGEHCFDRTIDPDLYPIRVR
ncbi:MAG: DUF5671 domain-containing protein [Thermodesulfobacteriota bacterium]